jgi:environmental stress-induced protein Ves
VIEIISPEEFKTIPWKNGQGSTTELVISPGATLDGFDWRLSIAKVDQDGDFSDFSGYMRDLVLIEGQGITLQHVGIKSTETHELSSLLTVSHFDGGCKTFGQLASGPIKDFNIMVNKNTYQSRVETYLEKQTIELKPKEICFVFCLSGELKLKSTEDNTNTILSERHLLKISASSSKQLEYLADGEKMIVVYIEALG